MQKLLLLLMAFIVTISSAMAQKEVTGKVTDDTGQPLPGATIVVKGTSNGTVSNSDGNYSILNVPDNAVLVFSFVGMLTREVTVGNQTTVNISLDSDAIGIQEVVAIGYGVQKKSDVTGATVSVSAEELSSRPVKNALKRCRVRQQG